MNRLHLHRLAQGAARSRSSGVRQWVSQCLFYLCLLIGVSHCDFDVKAKASTIVAPNIYTTTEAPSDTVGIFRGGNSPLTFQWVLPASDFSTVPIGSLMTAIGFRLDARLANLPISPINIAQWNLQLSKSTSASLILSSTFASNIGPDVVTVRSGPLTIPALAFGSSSVPNPFYDILFATPYVYKGGNLLITLRHTSHSGEQSLITNDADAVSGGRGQSNGSSGFTSTTGITDFYNFPVTQFTFVPEPASLLLAASGVAPIIGPRRRSRCETKNRKNTCARTAD
jgi:hypothetical protein